MANFLDSKCYAELLERIQSLDTGSTTSGDPFLAVANAAEKADIYPELDHEDYPEIVYWHKSDYLSDHRGGHGVIRTTSTADSGALKFITNEDGIVVSEAREILCAVFYPSQIRLGSSFMDENQCYSHQVLLPLNADHFF